MKLALWLMAIAAPLGAECIVWLDLSGEWRIKPSDNTEYASPSLNDSDWQTLRLPKDRTRPSREFWLRKWATLPECAAGQPLSLTLGLPNSGAYEVYWSGLMVGRTGHLDDMSDAEIPRPRTFNIPKEAVTANAPTLIAIRASSLTAKPPSWSMPDQGPYLITSPAQAPVNEGQRQMLERFTGGSTRLLFAASFAAVGLLGLMLWLSYRERQELLWFSLVLLFKAIGDLYSVYGFLSGYGEFNASGAATRQALISASVAPVLGTFVAVLSGRRSRVVYAAIWIGWMVLPASIYFRLDHRSGLYFAQIWVYSIAVATLIRTWWRATRKGDFRAEAHLLRMFVLLYLFGVIRNWASLALESRALYSSRDSVINGFRLGQYSVSATSLLLAAVMLAVMTILIRNIAADRKKKQRLEDEMYAAQTMQRLLLPVTTGEGFQAVYEPAREVGGDFYQVAERSDGSRMVLVGDVSGKGLEPAMTAAVVVGAFRSTNTQSPADVLSILNRALAGQGRKGFVTCCCARFGPDGSVVMANAGHPSPYADGRELDLPAGLPLGITEAAEYEDARVEGSAFTFISDGVLEAANPAGELFGFERTRELSGKSAQAIADAAKSWGQNDDITVVTVRRAA